MRIAITTGGSRGDVQPYVALGGALRAAGNEVLVAAPTAFEGLTREHGLGFHPIRMDALSSVRRVLEKGDANLLEFAWRGRAIYREAAREDLHAYLEACEGADAIVYSLVGFYGYQIARELGVPSIGAVYGPLLNPTRAFPSSFVPVPSGKLEVVSDDGRGLGELVRGAYNRLTYTCSQQLLWQLMMRAPVNEALRGAGLARFPFWGPFGELRGAPILGGWSKHVLPQPPDWGERLPVTGYWFLDGGSGWRPPEGLADFLDAGPPPVSVGFGSMSGADPEALKDVVGALRRAGVRGVLLSGWANVSGEDLPDEVYAVEDVPHDWLFGRVAAAVHHGGAGTTAASLRAGKPTVVVPFTADQSFWGARVAALGVGPRPIPVGRLSADRLGDAIYRAVTDAGMKARSRRLGEQIRSEDGLGRAVEAFHRYAARS